MKALLQRVTHASVVVDGSTVSAIDHGLLVLVGIEPADTEATARRMIERLLNYRVFGDDQGRMNRNVQDVAGGLLLVSQFTLAADTRQGNRPGFSTAAAPADAERLFNWLVDHVATQYQPVATGQFGAHMTVSLVNDGPVTFLLDVGPSA